MSTLESKLEDRFQDKLENKWIMLKAILIYVGVALFCFVFYLVYDRFSHDEHSVYMTFLWAWPTSFGLVPCLLILFIRKLKLPGRISTNVYNSGVAAVTVSSLLRGIFEIAGTGSDLQTYLMYFGYIMIGAGFVIYWTKK